MDVPSTGAVCLIHGNGAVDLIPIDTTYSPLQIAKYICQQCTGIVVDIIVETDNMVVDAILHTAIGKQLQHEYRRIT